MSTVAHDICLVGHPFAPIGMGEQLRASFRALRSIGVRPALLDVYEYLKPDPEAEAEFGPFLEQGFRTINLFHINGNEVEPVLQHLSGRSSPPEAWKVVSPVWELPRYPAEWARQLERFDEVWASSRFVEESLTEAVQRPIAHVPQACEVVLSSFRSRRFFGIPESAYAFLYSFDLRSWVTRKNPEAVVAAFRRVVQQRPHAPATLVLKVNGAELGDERYQSFLDSLEDLRERVVLIPRTLTDDVMKSLVRCCDCYVSLHRSEGFGRGPAEAMFLGKPVIATRWSGNLDYMNAGNSLLVDHVMTPVAPEAYPHWEGQQWAEPDVDQAVGYMVALIDEPQRGLDLGQRARLEMRRDFSFRAIGVRTLERLERGYRGGAPVARSVTAPPPGPTSSPRAPARSREIPKDDRPFGDALRQIDDALRSGEWLGPSLLSRIPLEVLGDVYLGLYPEYPSLTGALPPMPPAQVQRDWANTDGKPLMVLACAFVESVTRAFGNHVGRPLDQATVLDHGCGWGRMLRLMLRYTPGERIWGLDPWERSIELCREHRLPVNLAVCDDVPETLPVGKTRFDLIFAFSVFTHLSPRTASRVMQTLRTYLREDGLLAITVRPEEYWREHVPFAPGFSQEAMIAAHRKTGFAFLPHNRAPIDGEITYGDASYSLDYVQKSWPGWKLLGTETNPGDPLQTIVFLRPAPG